MSWEEKILEYLVENYRKSKKDTGENLTNRRTQVKPEKLYKKYCANNADFDVINSINCAVEKFCKRGFLTYTRERFGTQIQYIYLVDEQIDQVEEYLHKKYSYIPKGMKKDEVQSIIDKYRDQSKICDMECTLLQNELDENRIPKDYEMLPKILDAIAFIENNKIELYVREASMEIYGDSKYFENSTIIQVCNILRKYNKKQFETDEMLDEILLDYHIKKESQKFSIKGKFTLVIDSKKIDFSSFSYGIELDTNTLSKIDRIEINTSKFITVENRTSYLRYSDPDTVTFYLGGYANRFQRDFIKKVYETNSKIDYLHFGDIDAGGFWIHHNLCDITGVNFQLFCMSKNELSQKQYAHCVHQLTENDISRLQELRGMEMYSDTIEYMLNKNVKLEQEIVSLELMK